MIEILKNKQMLSIGRVSNMCWLIFGDLTQGQEKYSLHLQCPWRIVDVKNHIIEIASSDIYEPNSTRGVEDKEFEWDIQGNNLFDEKVNYVLESKQDFFVKQVVISECNDLKIVFSNERVLECFIDASTDVECWRFFRQGGGEHYVVGGKTSTVE